VRSAHGIAAVAVRSPYSGPDGACATRGGAGLIRIGADYKRWVKGPPVSIGAYTESNSLCNKH